MILLKNNYYEEDEKLFSTGDSELDDILEEVYYSGIEDGYDLAYEERDFAKPGNFDNFLRKTKRDFGYWATLKKECSEMFPLNAKDKTRISALQRLSRETGNKRVSNIVRDISPAYA